MSNKSLKSGIIQFFFHNQRLINKFSTAKVPIEYPTTQIFLQSRATLPKSATITTITDKQSTEHPSIHQPNNITYHVSNKGQLLKGMLV